MRKARITAGAVLVIMLAGCTSLPDLSGAQDEDIDKQVMSDVEAAKEAAAQYIRFNPTQTLVGDKELLEYGFDAANTTQTLTVYLLTPPAFCVDATSRTGSAFKAGSKTQLTEGYCEPGVDY
jgi:hypothetical protein